MKFKENLLEEAKEEAIKILNEKEDKSVAVVEAIEKLNEAKYADLIAEIREEEQKAKSDAEYAKTLNLRVLTQKEKDFYEKIRNPKMALTADQEDVIPTTLIDITQENIKKESGILGLVRFAPAGVRKWISAQKTGTFSWGDLFGEIGGELSAAIKGLNVEISKLSAYLIIPKAIRDLSLPFVDKYFMSILLETMNDGLEYGYLQGNGKNEPIGIYKKIESVNEDGTHKDKDINIITKFTPKALAPAKVYLCNNGTRTLGKLYLICNPEDRANYVDPAILNAKGDLVSSYKNLEVIDCANNPKGKAVLTIEQKYDMGMNSAGVMNYNQTKALEDADVVIAKVYANGRATDDNVAFVFDVTKLEEYVEQVYVVGGNINNTPAEVVAGA